MYVPDIFASISFSGVRSCDSHLAYNLCLILLNFVLFSIAIWLTTAQPVEVSVCQKTVMTRVARNLF